MMTVYLKAYKSCVCFCNKYFFPGRFSQVKANAVVINSSQIMTVSRSVLKGKKLKLQAKTLIPVMSSVWKALLDSNRRSIQSGTKKCQRQNSRKVLKQTRKFGENKIIQMLNKADEQSNICLRSQKMNFLNSRSNPSYMYSRQWKLLKPCPLVAAACE